VASMMVLTAAFINAVRPQLGAGPGEGAAAPAGDGVATSSDAGDAAITVVNISSLLALQPFRSLTLYCAGKAARDMFGRVLAAEEPAVRVLSYAPGPLRTDMADDIAANAGDEELRQMYREGVKEGFLDCDVSAARLVTILEEGKFASGDHVDYYDEL